MELKEIRTEPKELHIEWQNLRAEIFELDKACLTILQITIAISAALIGWHSSAKAPDWGMITILSPIGMLSYSYLYHKRLSMRRIEGYLRVAIGSEDYTPGRRLVFDGDGICGRTVGIIGMGAIDRTVLTPHLGSAVDDVRREITLQAARSLVQAVHGEVPLGSVNRSADQSVQQTDCSAFSS